jgi:hypothetical protein
MKYFEEIINIDELQILLNKFNDNIECDFPIFSKFRLLTAEPVNNGYAINIDNLNFDKIYTELDDKQQSEFPEFKDFRECFLSSGCIGYKNHDDFVKKYNIIQNLHSRMYIALDTNILYHRYFSFSEFNKKQVLVSKSVKKEIENSINYKYNSNQIRTLKNAAEAHFELLDNLQNCRMKRSRIARDFAIRELKNINKLLVQPADYEANNYEKKDIKIIKDYKNYAIKNNIQVLILSADNTIRDCCEIENVEYFIFDYPKKINVDQVPAHNFRNLVYNLAVTFGFIKLNSVIIFGEYHRKGDFDNLKIKFLDENLFNEFEKDLRICRKLMKLDIDF